MIVFYFMVFLLVVITACFTHYIIWRAMLIKKLYARSSIVPTAMGPVEYISIGPADGPVLLLSHGGGSGCDNAYLYDFLVNEGIRIICPSKPGYLRTPLEAGKTFEEHADLLAIPEAEPSGRTIDWYAPFDGEVLYVVATPPINQSG